MKNNRIILILLGVILIFILISFFGKNKNPENLTVFEKIKTEISKQADIESKERDNFSWVKDSYVILVPADDSFYTKKQSDTHLEFDDVPNLFKKEINITKDVLKDNDFVLNEENSSKDFSDRTFYDYIQSYQKDEELCVLKINPDDLGYYQFNFVCGNSLDKAYKEQLPFLEALNYKNTSNSVHLRNQSGDFYQLGVGSFRSGSTSILKKENDSYRVLYIRQEDPNCEEIEDENITKETLELFKINGCWNGENGYIKFN